MRKIFKESKLNFQMNYKKTLILTIIETNKAKSTTTTSPTTNQSSIAIKIRTTRTKTVNMNDSSPMNGQPTPPKYSEGKFPIVDNLMDVNHLRSSVFLSNYNIVIMMS